MYQAHISIVLQGEEPASIKLPLREDIAAELYVRAQEAKLAIGDKRLAEIVAYSWLGSLLALDQTEPIPPTVPQIKFALDIARELGIELPVGALQSRVVIGFFITQHRDRLRRRPKGATPSTK